MPEITEPTIKETIRRLGFRPRPDASTRNYADTRDYKDYSYLSGASESNPELNLGIGSFNKLNEPTLIVLHKYKPKFRLTLRGAARIRAKLAQATLAARQIIDCLA